MDMWDETAHKLSGSWVQLRHCLDHHSSIVDKNAGAAASFSVSVPCRSWLSHLRPWCYYDGAESQRLELELYASC